MLADRVHVHWRPLSAVLYFNRASLAHGKAKDTHHAGAGIGVVGVVARALDVLEGRAGAAAAAATAVQARGGGAALPAAAAAALLLRQHVLQLARLPAMAHQRRIKVCARSLCVLSTTAAVCRHALPPHQHVLQLARLPAGANQRHRNGKAWVVRKFSSVPRAIHLRTVSGEHADEAGEAVNALIWLECLALPPRD